MGKNNQGSALARVLNRSLGITEKAMWLSQETVDLDSAYKRLLQAYDDIPDFDDAWQDIQGRFNKLTETIKTLETAGVTNTPKARTEHTEKIEAQILLAKALKADIGNKAKDLATRRAKALKACAALKEPAGADDAQCLRLSQQRKLVTDQLPTAGLTEQHLLDAAKAQQALVKRISDIEGEITARQAFINRLAEVASELKAAGASLGGASAVHLQGLLGTAETTGKNATSTVGWKKAVTDLDAVALKTTQAVAYNVQYEQLSKLAVNYTNAAPPTELVRLNKLITDAAGLATGHDYVGASKKLADFEGDPNTQVVKAFYDALTKFRADVGAQMALLQKKSLPNTPANLKPNDELQAIKNACIGNAAAVDYQNATAALGVLKKRLADSHAYALRYNELHAFSTSPDFALLATTEKNAITQALQQAKALADASPGNPADALSKLQPPALSAAKVNQPIQASKLAAQAAAVCNGLILVAPGSGAALYIKGLLDAADLKFKAKDFVAAEGLFNTLLPIAKDALAYAERLKVAQSTVNAVTLPGKPDVLKAPLAKAASRDYADAILLINTGLQTLASFQAYSARLAEVAALKAALPSTATEALAQVDDALLEAAKLAKAEAFADALAALEALARMPELVGPHQDVTSYFKQRQAMDKPYDTADKALPLPQAKLVLKQLWDDAATLASQHTYKGALKKLAELQGHLPPAMRFIAERQAALVVSKNLSDLDTAGKGVYTVTDSKAHLNQLLTEVDNAGKLADFAEALKKLAAFRTKAKGLCVTAADNHDANEGTPNVHPHSVDKHLKVTDNDKETRVKTGVPPPPTQAASSFDDAECWVAAKEAATAIGKARAGYKLTDDKTTVPDNTRIAIHVEHNRPIGTAMIGVHENTKPKQSGPNKGELGGDTTFERAVKVVGYTRSTSVFCFDANAGAKGKWVLLTQYPYTESWDPELGCYTEPLPT